METEIPRMDAAVIGEGINVGDERIEKIRAKPGCLAFIETHSLKQIRFGRAQNFDLQGNCFRILFLAFSQDDAFILPD